MKRPLLIIIPILIIVAVIVWLLLRKKNPDTSTNTNDTSKNPADNFPLKYGSRGNNVIRLQQYLNKQINSDIVPYPGIHTIAEDGIWGRDTEDTVLLILNVKEVSQELFTSKYM